MVSVAPVTSTAPVSAKMRMTGRAWSVFAIGICGIVLTLALELFTDSDIALQDHLFNFRTGKWQVDSQARIPRLFFYSGPKAILFPAGAVLLIACFNQRLRRILRLGKQPCIYLFACLAAVPLVAGIGKNLTHVHCPSELERYGGTEKYAKVITSERPQYERIPPHCFPAGHASGGFALLAFYFVRRRPIWLLPGFVAGWIMGVYQMLKGAHFLSHTLTTMFLALALSALLSPILERTEKTSPDGGE